MLEHDVIVVGGGVAGLRAALAAKQAGVDVAVVSKLHPVRSSSAGTRAGINVALGADDSWEQHAHDTVRASDYLGEQDAIEYLCQEALTEIVTLDHMGALFNRAADRGLQLRRLCGSGQARSCFSDDLTGHILLHVLYEQVLKEAITTYDEWFVTSLLIDDGVCRGVVALDQSRGSIEALHAKAVLLATGHASQLYTSNAASAACTGDGISLAYNAGVALLDMEMVQYHPLAIGGRKSIPITRGLLGVGAHLINAAGERLMTGTAPDSMELAATDVCVYAIQSEIDAGHEVMLDASQVDSGLLKRQFSQTLSLVKSFTGCDLTKQPVAVRPAVLATLGGIAVNTDGETSVSGLYATGECANIGVRGAGELAGNALMESVVFGRQAGAAAAAAAQQSAAGQAPDVLLQAAEQRIQTLVQRDPNNDRPGKLGAELGALMEAKAGLLRCATGLTEATGRLDGLRQRVADLGLVNKQMVYNHELQAVLEVEALVQVAAATLAAAAARQESRGSHRREDFPQRDDANWLCHTVTTATPDGPKVDVLPVQQTRWQPERRTY
ncbi:MAG: FAD-binding protein [bacterium]|nr:FAD-binding protein [bacterium]